MLDMPATTPKLTARQQQILELIQTAIARADATAIARMTPSVLALADHDNAVHVDGFQQVAHRIHSSTVGCVLVAAAHPFRSRKGRRLGDTYEFHRQVAIGLFGKNHETQISPFATH